MHAAIASCVDFVIAAGLGFACACMLSIEVLSRGFSAALIIATITNNLAITSILTVYFGYR